MQNKHATTLEHPGRILERRKQDNLETKRRSHFGARKTVAELSPEKVKPNRWASPFPGSVLRPFSGRQIWTPPGKHHLHHFCAKNQMETVLVQVWMSYSTDVALHVTKPLSATQWHTNNQRNKTIIHQSKLTCLSIGGHKPGHP